MSKFDVQPVSAPKRGSFRLGNMHTTTLDFGRLQCAKIMECVPNDVINVNLGAFVQAAPNPSPINGKMTFSAHAFFVPTRVICEEWNNYILGLSNPTLPYCTSDDIEGAITQLASTSQIMSDDSIRHCSDLGLPYSYVNGEITGYRVSALPLRAFNRVWWDWYRDKQRISDANESSYCYKSMGSISTTEVAILSQAKYRCFTKDYITTAYDQPSEGGIMSVAPVITDDDTPNFKVFNPENTIGARGTSTSSVSYDFQPYGVAAASASATTLSNGSTTGATNRINSRNKGSNSTDYGVNSSALGALSVSVSGMRGAAAYQRYLERLLVSGKSVISRLKSLFNADDTPERLDMSEYLGGKSVDFSFQNTTATSSGTNIWDPQSGASSTYNAFGSYGSSASDENLLGQQVTNGYADLNFDNITYHAKEHGYLLIVTSILPVVANFQGIDRMWLRGVATGTTSRFDFFTPDMENVGFQPILMSEVVSPYTYDNSTISGAYDGLSVFGWQQRYMDYKYSHDEVSGDFVNPNTSLSLQAMHLGRNILREKGYVTSAGAAVTGGSAPGAFASVVTPASLVTCDPASRTMYDDKFTISSNRLDHFVVNYKFDITAVRPMQENVLPSLEDEEGKAIMSVPTGGVRL